MAAFDPTLPFVLLDDAAAGRARLFTGLAEAVTTADANAVPAALDRLRDPGPWAGFIGYEAGAALDSVLVAAAPPAGEPLLWMGRFRNEQAMPADELSSLLPDRPAMAGPVRPAVTPAAHADAVRRIQALIAAGDIYQANLTFAAAVPVGGHPLALYRRVRAGARAPFGGVVFTGDLWLLSFSPELFFRLDGRRLMAKPMKGTVRRGHDAAADAAAAATLAADPKNRAENLMITDLLRNDLSRVANKVEVPSLFALEDYPTVWQMTSTVTATARPGVAATDVLAAMFPCGSVTGAPKVRAMQVIAAVEAGPRGAYTGSIGVIDAAGDAEFNVAIRTLVLRRGARTARLGLGSGIVADSAAAAEWQECLDKAAFLHRRPAPDLIETLRVAAGQVFHIDLHLARLAASAARLGHRFDAVAARAAIVAAADGVDAARLRLLLAPSGATAVQSSPLPTTPDLPVTVALASLPVCEDDWRLRHKTSDRAFYDDARRSGGAFEVVFHDSDGRLTEGSFTNVFVERDGILLTPPLTRGLLPGVLRTTLIADGRAREHDLTAADLAAGFLIGNAVRGLLPARLAD